TSGALVLARDQVVGTYRASLGDWRSQLRVLLSGLAVIGVGASAAALSWIVFLGSVATLRNAGLVGVPAALQVGLGAFSVVLVGLTAGGAVFVSRANAPAAKTELRTQPVTKGSVIQSVAVSGSVAAMNQTKMTFRTTGKIAEIYVSVGQQVTAGQPLAKLDTTDLDAALAQAQANLVTAQNNYNRTASTTSDAQKSLNQARQQAAQDLAKAPAALNKLVTNYNTAKNNANALTGSIYTDLLAYESAIDAIATDLDGALNEPTQSGSDFRNAINAL